MQRRSLFEVFTCVCLVGCSTPPGSPLGMAETAPTPSAESGMAEPDEGTTSGAETSGATEHTTAADAESSSPSDDASSTTGEGDSSSTGTPEPGGPLEPGGPSLCELGLLPVCTSFDDLLEPDQWSIDDRVDGGGVTFEAIDPYRGEGAMHTEGARDTYLFRNIDDVKQDGIYYGRLFIKFEALQSGSHTSIVHTRSNDSNVRSRIVVRTSTVDGEVQGLWGYGSVGGGGNDWAFYDGHDDHSANPVVLDTWICLEWMQNDLTSESRIWTDGVEHEELHMTAEVYDDYPPPFEELPEKNIPENFRLPSIDRVFVGIGIHQFSSKTIIDEVALSNERIGCAM